MVPFRGSYSKLVAGRRDLINGLVYPVPDPSLPFLGVHFTPRIDDEVLIGPNAVLALARHRYGRLAFSPRDALATASFPGFWRLARRYPRYAAAEVSRDLIKPLLVRQTRRSSPGSGLPENTARAAPAPNDLRGLTLPAGTPIRIKPLDASARPHRRGSASRRPGGRDERDRQHRALPAARRRALPARPAARATVLTGSASRRDRDHAAVHPRANDLGRRRAAATRSARSWLRAGRGWAAGRLDAPDAGGDARGRGRDLRPERARAGRPAAARSGPRR